MAYESISLVPHSITRTLFEFQTELTGQLNSLVFQEFRVAKYQALTSLQYMDVYYYLLGDFPFL